MNRLVKTEEQIDNRKSLCISHRYDYLNNRIATVDLYGNETRYEYDDFGRVVKVHYPPALNEHGEMTQSIIAKTYDAMGNVTSITDPMGRVTRAAYTLHKKPYWISYPDGTEARCEYTLYGQVKKSTARDGSHVIYEYDYMGRPTKKELFAADGTCQGISTRTYNAFHLLEETTVDGQTTFYTYDGAGRLIRTETGEKRTDYLYDSLGRQCEVREFFGYAQDDYVANVSRFDLLNRLVRQEVTDGVGIIYSVVEYAYDAAGNRIQTITHNQAGKAVETVEYDPLGRVIKKEDALHNVTHCWYDHSQNHPYTEITDPLGNKVCMTKDPLGRLKTLKRLNPYGIATKQADYYYDAAGNKARQVDTVYVGNEPLREVVSCYEYDEMNFLKTAHEAVGTPEQTQTNYHYNARGMLQKMVKPDGTEIIYQHDARGRLLEYKSSDGSVHYAYRYDEHEHPSQIEDLLTGETTLRKYSRNLKLETEKLANGLEVCYTHDRLGRQVGVTLPDGSQIAYRYRGPSLKEVKRLDSAGITLYNQVYREFDLSGNLISADLPGDCGELRCETDILNRPTRIQAAGRKETLDQYDAMGHLMRMTLQDAVGTCVNEYTYDDLCQLTGETGAATHSYVNDSLYNHVSKNGAPQSFNALNQILEDAQAKYEYDLNGNLKKQKRTDGEVSYAYDALGRLVRVQTASQHITYKYDSFNRRLSKVVCEGDQQIEAARYLYTGMSEIGAFDEQGRAVELRLLGVGQGAELGASFAHEIEGSVYVPLHDHQGNVAALLDLQGNLIETYRYSAFGLEQLFDGEGQPLESSVTPWRFAGKRKDSETGFIYFGARYYNPETATWITPDPLSKEGGPNLYAYVMHDPMTLCDLYGYIAEDSQGMGDQFMNSELVRSSLSPIKFGLPYFEFPPSKPIVFNHFETFKEKSGNYVLEGRPNLENKGFGFCNGINTSFDGAKNHATYMSNMTGGLNVNFTHNASTDVLTDCYESNMGLLGIATEPAVLIANQWKNFFNIHPPGSLYFHIAHSQGAIHTYNALLLCPPEIRNRLYVVTVEGAKQIPDGLCRYVNNIQNSSRLRDPIPHLGLIHKVLAYCISPISSFKKYRTETYTMTYVDSDPSESFFDHDFQSATYKPYIQEDIRTFMEVTIK